MQTDQLQAFCYIVEEKSFSRAASRMFITQPAISMQIKSLEQGIGQALFDRSRKEVIPTEAGKILYRHARNIFDEIESARNQIDAVANLVRGRLTVGCSDTVSSYILPPYLSEFLKKYPELEITVQNRPSQHIVAMVLESSADIGFVTLPVVEQALSVRPFLSYNDVAICSKDHPFTKSARLDLPSLAAHRLLLLEPGTKSRMLLDEEFARARLSPSMIMGFGSVEVQKAFAKTGIGVAIVPDFAVKTREDRNSLAVLPVKGINKREIGIVVRKNRILSIATQRFSDFITR